MISINAMQSLSKATYAFLFRYLEGFGKKISKEYVAGTIQGRYAFPLATGLGKTSCCKSSKDLGHNV